MSNISQEQFNHYAEQGYNKVPVVREILADLDTPLSAYLKLANEPYTYLLESVQGGEKWGRYSIIGLAANTVLRISDHTVSIEENGKLVSETEVDDPLAEIESFKAQFKIPHVDGLPRFTGGLVGYFGYDTVRYIEPRLGKSSKDDPLGCPDIMLLVSDRVVIFDNVSGKVLLLIHVDPSMDNAFDMAQQQLDEFAGKLAMQVNRPESTNRQHTSKEEDFVSGFTQEKYERAIDKIKRYIVEGDVMQVVPSQRLTIPFVEPPLNLYRALRTMNPSPHMYYYNMGDFHIVGTSPEILVRLEDNLVTVRPIAGTRPRGNNEEEDKALEEDLLSDPKELAEHLMLIDLGRNDVGRVAKVGSVKLTEKMTIERYSHVIHIVSNVVGDIAESKSATDVLRATFPAGTVTGAPKIRAMEIIDELEPVKRGIYAGAVGYISWKETWIPPLQSVPQLLKITPSISRPVVVSSPIQYQKTNGMKP